MILKICNKCGAVVKVLKDCKCNDCRIKCCEESMNLIKSNSTDASFEKHIPIFEIMDDKVKVIVNHVMDEDHYIEWISLESNDTEITVKLKPGQTAEVTFPYIKDATVYAYCSKHGLWETKIK